MVKLIIQLDKKLSYNITSRLQGYIMERLDFDYANYLHDIQYHPYTQYIEKRDNNSTYWHINLLDDIAVEKISRIFSINQNIELNNELSFDIIDIQKIEVSKKVLLKDLSIINPNRYINIKFVTPTSFKTNDMYYFWPDIRLIFNSILMRYNMFSDEFTFDGVDVIDDIVDNFYISNYAIKTRQFYLERVKIKGFIGYLNIRLGGSAQLANIGRMLLKYAELTGIGIKTSMGMGGLQIVKGDKFSE